MMLILLLFWPWVYAGFTIFSPPSFCIIGSFAICILIFLLSDGILLVLNYNYGLIYGPIEASVTCFSIIASLLLLFQLPVSLSFCVSCWSLWLGALLLLFFHFLWCLCLFMVKGCKIQFLWPMASPVKYIFWSICLFNGNVWLLALNLHLGISITYGILMVLLCLWLSVTIALAISCFPIVAVLLVTTTDLLPTLLVFFVGSLFA